MIQSLSDPWVSVPSLNTTTGGHKSCESVLWFQVLTLVSIPLLRPLHGRLVHLIDDHHHFRDPKRLCKQCVLTGLAPPLEPGLELALPCRNNLAETGPGRQLCPESGQFSIILQLQPFKKPLERCPFLKHRSASWTGIQFSLPPSHP
jgi:hypothetical protein